MKKFFLWTMVLPFYCAFLLALVQALFGGQEPPVWLALLSLAIALGAFIRIHVTPVSRAKRDSEARLEEEKMRLKEELRISRQENLNHLENIAREKKELQEVAHREKEEERKRVERENYETVAEELNRLSNEVVSGESRVLEKHIREYKRLVASVAKEVDILRDIRARHPVIGTFLSTRTESDLDSDVFKDLERIFSKGSR